MSYADGETCWCGYGSFHGGDPRLFHPDPECSTEEEREAHRRDCERWSANEAAGVATLPEQDTHRWLAEGDTVIHLALAGYGLGTSTCDACAERDSKAVRP